MRKALILFLAFFLLSGFKWGSSSDDDSDKKKSNTSSYSSNRSSSSNYNSYKSSSKSSDEDAIRNVQETFASDDPDELKTRVESLARISRALKALGKTKGG